MQQSQIHIKKLGICEYLPVWQRMKAFTESRDISTPDEIWVVEHLPVFTQGQAGRPEHVLNPKDIPIVQTDRGGQITYHGPGQLVVYPLIDIRRAKIGVRQFVSILENSVIDFLSEYQINAKTKSDAPGVYVDGMKICSIGLKIKKGCAYHGLAFNINMDLEPFSRINPCGFSQLKMTQMSDFVSNIKVSDVEDKLCRIMIKKLYE
jgi:lipoyl(octanoyl) transferase